MASLKQLQLLEDRERRERGLPISQTILKPTKSSKSPMLMRHNPETIDNPDRHLMFKNLNEFTLTIPTDDKLAENDEAVEDITSITPDEMSSELLSICEEKEHLVSIILNDIQTFKTHQLSQMSHRTKQIAFQVRSTKPYNLVCFEKKKQKWKKAILICSSASHFQLPCMITPRCMDVASICLWTWRSSPRVTTQILRLQLEYCLIWKF